MLSPHDPKYSLVNSTESELEQIRNHILNEPGNISCSFKQLGKQFLSNFSEFSQSIGKEPFNVTRKKYLSLYPEISASKDELSFYEFICHKHLYIEQEPCQCFSSIYAKGIENLGEIEQNIRRYEQKIEQNKVEISSMSPEETRAKDALWSHIVSLNKKAKEEIVEFLTSHKIIEATIDEAQRSPDKGRGLALILETINPSIFRYSYKKGHYQIEEGFELDAKFILLRSLERKEKKEIYIRDKSGNKSVFHREVNKYIKNNDVISKLSDYIDSNYFLHKRRHTLEAALKAFKKREYLAFIYLAIFQIEGIFDDYRKVMGYKIKEFEFSSINAKTKDVWGEPKSVSTLYAYEYYTFIFPILRNQLAHGKQIDDIDNIEFEAKLVLLDLFYPCSELANNQHSSKINQLIQVVIEIKGFNLDQDQFSFEDFDPKFNLLYFRILIYCILTRVHKEKLEDFPEFNATIEFIENLIKEEQFFLFIYRSLHLYKTDKFNIYDEIEILVHKLKKEMIAENSRIAKLRSEILKITNQGKKSQKNYEDIEKMINKFQKETTLETSKISELGEILKITNQESKKSQVNFEAEESPAEVNYCEIGENIEDALRNLEL